MVQKKEQNWQDKVLTPEEVLAKITPGMNIFLGTGVGEPLTLVKGLMKSGKDNLQDLELIQLVSLGDAVSVKELTSRKFRLRTFFSGWVASEAIESGRVDMIPSRFSRIPELIKTDMIPIDAAFVQITPPDKAGYCSLSVAPDISIDAIEKASLVVGEINREIPRTLGDTFVHVDKFDYLVESTESPIYFPRWPVDQIFQKVAVNVASLIEDKSCLFYSIGPLYEALSEPLSAKKDLGVHSPFITDALMDLIKSGAVTNRYKKFFRGKCLTTYAFGTAELMSWLDNNPQIEFQGTEVVFNPENIACNPKFIFVLPARKVDLSGNVALHTGKGNVAAGPDEANDFFFGARLSKGGRTIFALPSRNLEGKSNIRGELKDLPNQFSNRESVDMIVTEFGVAFLTGQTIRERAQALIDIAHPDDREHLVKRAKQMHIIYQDQIFLAESGHLYPDQIACTQEFKDDLLVNFRAIKPSDEEAMRRLFYRFSDQSVYYRYFSPIKTMPHKKMQEYVNVDYRGTMSVVGLVIRPSGKRRIVAEGRYVRHKDRPFGDVAFVVDEDYQGRGIATYLLNMIIRLARDRGIEGLTADVLATNKAMMKVFERCPYPVQAVVESGVYELVIPFAGGPATKTNPITYNRPC